MEGDTMVKVAALILALLLAHTQASAQLSGGIRTAFIDSARNSCFATQRKLTANASASEGVLKRYCNCNAQYMADSLSNELVMEIEKGKARLPVQLPELSGKYCGNNFDKFPPF